MVVRRRKPGRHRMDPAGAYRAWLWNMLHHGEPRRLQRVRADGMTFDELFAEHDLTPEERAALVAYLASLRMMATLRALMTPNVK